MHPPIIQNPKVLHFRIKARVDFPVCRIRSRESLCDCCVVLTLARFMVISRIDNIKYGAAAGRDCQIKQQFINPHLCIGHGVEAQFRGEGWSVEREYGEFMGDDTLENGCCPHVYSALSTIQCATPKHFSPQAWGMQRSEWSEQKQFKHKGIGVVLSFSHQQYYYFIQTHLCT